MAMVANRKKNFGDFNGTGWHRAKAKYAGDQ
jgi:hypothetical protein